MSAFTILIQKCCELFCSAPNMIYEFENMLHSMQEFSRIRKRITQLKIPFQQFLPISENVLKLSCIALIKAEHIFAFLLKLLFCEVNKFDNSKNDTHAC